MVVEKHKNDYGMFDIVIKESNKVLTISLCGEDHNFSCRYDTLERISEISFEISEAEGELYPIFEKLYSSIVSGNLFNGSLNDPSTITRIETEQSYTWYRDIVGENGITVISDATPVTCPNTLQIRKEQGKIELLFLQEDGRDKGYPKNPYSINIHIRQSGSKLYDFCFPFKTLYNDLQNITPKKDVKELKRSTENK